MPIRKPRSHGASVARQEAASRCGAFTVKELLVVIVVMMVVAVIALPHFTGAAEQTREEALIATLAEVRDQLERYRQDHQNRYPRLDRFEDQMTRYTNPAGQSVQQRMTGFPLGPYVVEIPINPYTGGRSVSDTAPGTSDWFYDERTGAFHANHHPAYMRY